MINRILHLWSFHMKFIKLAVTGLSPFVFKWISDALLLVKNNISSIMNISFPIRCHTGNLSTLFCMYHLLNERHT